MSHLAPQHLIHTRMGPSLPWHHASLMKTPQYVASPDFKKYAQWLEIAGTGGGKVFVETTPSGTADEAVAIIVGCVSPNKLFVGSKGSWHEKFGTEFAKTKFQVTLLPPKDTDFIDDFKEALDVLAASQRSAGITGDNKNLFAPDSSSMGIRFSASVFKELGIEEWKVPTDVQSELDKIKQSHEVCPLLVYDEQDNRILPEKVAGALSGTLVEMHFTLLHWVIHPKDQKPFDSFMARIVQICILGPPTKTSSLPGNYRTDRKRPYRPLAFRKLVEEQHVATKHFHPANVANVEKAKEIVDRGSVPKETGGDADSGSTISEWSRSDQDEAEKSNGETSAKPSETVELPSNLEVNLTLMEKTTSGSKRKAVGPVEDAPAHKKTRKNV
ncbi:uncharacterized protein ARMOST_04510 [Armillaria ostoyae]|uniref:Uncharacterized protein n=1 Tax=Armillaria ostoyae TaxID=47428 RepID=A0A284QXS2_ARMOS|nr:uncharacterized protein ARMOST_04510 [Armillaria ostoyae]